MADVTILPVVRVEGEKPRKVVRPQDLPPSVTDINAFRYLRERAAVERRDRQSLLPGDCRDA